MGGVFSKRVSRAEGFAIHDEGATFGRQTFGHRDYCGSAERASSLATPHRNIVIVGTRSLAATSTERWRPTRTSLVRARDDPLHPPCLPPPHACVVRTSPPRLPRAQRLAPPSPSITTTRLTATARACRPCTRMGRCSPLRMSSSWACRISCRSSLCADPPLAHAHRHARARAQRLAVCRRPRQQLGNICAAAAAAASAASAVLHDAANLDAPPTTPQHLTTSLSPRARVCVCVCLRRRRRRRSNSRPSCTRSRRATRSRRRRAVSS